MAWRVARCLDKLLAEINASAPNRSKRSDGSIGDAAHQGTGSDHNPHCQGYVVTARDYTHDPNGGFDSYAFADWLRRRCKGDILHNGAREHRVKYIISNKRIASPTNNWAWRYYGGSNAHDHHAHVSCDCTADGGYMDSTADWGWAATGVIPKPPTPTPVPPSPGTAPPFPLPSGHYFGTPRNDSACHSGYYSSADRVHIARWQTQMRNRGWTIGTDGFYGPQSESVCRAFQQDKGLSVDGLCGAQTWSASWTAPVT